MQTSRILCLVFLVTTSCSGKHAPCIGSSSDYFSIVEGESLYFVPPYITKPNSTNGVQIQWSKNKPEGESEDLTSDETKHVHVHDEALFLLNARVDDSGRYVAQEHWQRLDECYEFIVNVKVFKPSAAANAGLRYGKIDNPYPNKLMPCPDPVSRTCQSLQGSITWEKDSKPLTGKSDYNMRIYDVTKSDLGNYTCTCTWTHNNKEYKSSGTRELAHQDQGIHFSELIFISPTGKEQVADEGAELKLNCSVFCGTNIKDDCEAEWIINGNPVTDMQGYHQTVNVTPSNKTISTAVLTIHRVSANDFKTTFKCHGKGSYRDESIDLTLTRRASITPLVVGGVCALLLCVAAAALAKHFTVDIALFFRSWFPLSLYSEDFKVYDAYVVYQTQSLDKDTEDTLCQFVSHTLPAVLEDKCGYRLFIHGRDDIPGEDHLLLVEERMKQSRRLMVVLTPASDSQNIDQNPEFPLNPVVGGFDWQVGLHHVLMQREMRVILVQLGDTGPQGYAHLPPGLQHLIQRSSPIRWSRQSRGAAASNSRFWKRVRYLMPAAPALKPPPGV